MKFLLDTDHVSILQHKTGVGYGTLAGRMSQHSIADFALSIVSFHEQVIGSHAFLNRARRPIDLIRGYEMLERVRIGYSSAPILPFDTSVATSFDQISRLRLRTATMDLRIAATALSRVLILLSRNRSDFLGIPGLIVEDWTA